MGPSWIWKDNKSPARTFSAFTGRPGKRYPAPTERSSGLRHRRTARPSRRPPGRLLASILDRPGPTPTFRWCLNLPATALRSSPRWHRGRMPGPRQLGRPRRRDRAGPRWSPGGDCALTRPSGTAPLPLSLPLERL